jgi:hypothetical protein
MTRVWFIALHVVPAALLVAAEQAVQATRELEDAKLADYIRAHAFTTVVGEIRFVSKGEWGAIARSSGAISEDERMKLLNSRTCPRRS